MPKKKEAGLHAKAIEPPPGAEEELRTDSLWILGKRDSTGVHTGDYHGNFVPQIPNQLIRRFTMPGDWVIDPFCGSGTTLIEAQRLGRNAVGIELYAGIAKEARKRVGAESKEYAGARTGVVTGDCTVAAVWKKACKHLPGDKLGNFDLAILHPPYHDIVKFGDHPRCLSNQPTVDDFLALFASTIKNAVNHLKKGKHLCIVIGDAYKKGEWIPLGFLCMQEALNAGLKLKSIVIKDMQDNRAKRNMQNLWRYRALKGGFYIFKHEYVLIYKKPV